MKLEYFIAVIFLIHSIANMPIYSNITLDNEKNFTDMEMGIKYYFTVNIDSKTEYIVKIKISSSELSSPTSLNLSYIGHYSASPNTKYIYNEGILSLSFSTDSEYHTYESIFTIQKSYYSRYVSLILTSKYSVNSISIMIAKSGSIFGFGINS